MVLLLYKNISFQEFTHSHHFVWNNCCCAAGFAARRLACYQYESTYTPWQPSGIKNSHSYTYSLSHLAECAYNIRCC